MAPRPFPVNPVYSALALSYRNDRLRLIADKVLPRVPVPASTFAWSYLPPEQVYTLPTTLVGRKGRVERIEFRGQQRESTTRDYGLEDGIPKDDIREAEAMRAAGQGTFDPMATAVEGLTDILLLDREVRVAEVVQDPANYAPGNRLALSGADRFSDPGSDVIGTLKAAFSATPLIRPNTMTMGREVWGALSSHPQLVNAIKGNVTSKGIIKPDDFVSLFQGEGLQELHIGEAFLNVARRGQPASFSRVWGKAISLTYLNPAARPGSGVTYGFTAQWGTRMAANWEDPNVGLRGGIVMRIGESVREVVSAPEAGYLIQNAIA